jgi:hypothetical protein
MGTPATIEIRKHAEDEDAIFLYTHHDGRLPLLKTFCSFIEPRWMHALNTVRERITPYRPLFPLLSRWCDEMEIFLQQPHTLSTLGWQLSNANFSYLTPHTHLATHGTQKKAERELLRQIQNTDFCFYPSLQATAENAPELTNRHFQITSTPTSQSHPHFIEFAYHDFDERTWVRTSHSSAHKVLSDTFSLPAFWLEWEQLFSTRLQSPPHLPFAPDYAHSMFDPLRSLRAILYQLKGGRGSMAFAPEPPQPAPINSATARSIANSHVPFGQHLGMIGQHLSFFRPLNYAFATMHDHLLACRSSPILRMTVLEPRAMHVLLDDPTDRYFQSTVEQACFSVADFQREQVDGLTSLPDQYETGVLHHEPPPSAASFHELSPQPLDAHPSYLYLHDVASSMSHFSQLPLAQLVLRQERHQLNTQHAETSSRTRRVL